MRAADFQRLFQLPFLRLGVRADGHVADVVRIDERSHQQERFFVFVFQERHALVGQLFPLVRGQQIKPDLVEFHRRVQLAAVGSLVAGLTKHAPHAVREDRLRHFQLRVVGFHADAAGHHAGEHAKPRRHAHRIAAVGPLEAGTGSRQAVHRRRAQVRIAGHAEHARVLLVGKDQQHIGLCGGRGPCRAAGNAGQEQGTQERESRHGFNSSLCKQHCPKQNRGRSSIAVLVRRFSATQSSGEAGRSVHPNES